MHTKILLSIAILITSFFASAQDKSDTTKDEDGNFVNASTTTPVANKIGTVRVKDSIYMLTGRGGNIGVFAGEDGILMIDSQFSDASINIQQRIRNISNKQVEILINTHHHGDHVGGNSNMAELGTMIFSHTNARSRIVKSFGKSDSEKIDSIVARSKDKIRTADDKESTFANAKRIVDQMPKNEGPVGALPTVSFSKDITFNYNGEEVKVTHLSNAHTDGDVMVYFTKSNVLHTGDAFFNGAYPFIDTENRGSLKGHIAGLEKIIRIADEDTKIIPGHGKVATINDVKYNLSMFRYLTPQIEIKILSNKTEAEVMAMRDLTKEYDEKGYGDGYITTEKFLKTLYGELNRK